jgi:cytochrome c oxidase subunit 2
MQHWWFPTNASSYGGDVDSLFVLILYITGAVFILVEVTLLIFLFKYRKREGRKASYIEGSLTAEIIWTSIPAVVCAFLGVFSQPLWSRIKDPDRIPADASPIDVTAKQFEWHFTYPGPDGHLGTADDFEKRNELHVVVNRNYSVRLQSEDVIHSFFIPAFRLKQDAVPGMHIMAWFQPTRIGEYELGCAELCGLGHYRMRARVFVQTPEEFAAWQTSLIAPPAPAPTDSTASSGRTAR